MAHFSNLIFCVIFVVGAWAWESKVGAWAWESKVKAWAWETKIGLNDEELSDVDLGVNEVLTTASEEVDEVVTTTRVKDDGPGEGQVGQDTAGEQQGKKVKYKGRRSRNWLIFHEPYYNILTLILITSGLIIGNGVYRLLDFLVQYEEETKAQRYINNFPYPPSPSPRSSSHTSPTSSPYTPSSSSSSYKTRPTNLTRDSPMLWNCRTGKPILPHNGHPICGTDCH